MLRRRPRRVAHHPDTSWLFLAALYLTATVVNAALALSVGTWWPALFAGLLAAITTACVVRAVRRSR